MNLFTNFFYSKIFRINEKIIAGLGNSLETIIALSVSDIIISSLGWEWIFYIIGRISFFHTIIIATISLYSTNII